MAQITPTVDLVEALVNLITVNEPIKELTDNGDGTYTINVCDVHYARPLCPITIGGVDYPVTEISGQDITFTASSAPVGSTFTLPAPFYFHGTPTATGAELASIQSHENKFPMVYLHEILRDRTPAEVDAGIQRESDVRIFFLDQANFEDWDTDQTYSDAINPMRNLCEAFLNIVKDNSGIAPLESDYDIFSYAKFGIRRNVNGVETNLFSEMLSGVELQITIPFKKSFVCNC